MAAKPKVDLVAMMNQGAYNPVENPLFGASDAMDAADDNDEDDDLLTELSKKPQDQANPLDRIDKKEPAKKKGLMDISDSDEDEEFSKKGKTPKGAAAANAPFSKAKTKVDALLDSESDEEDFKVKKKPAG